MLNPGHPNRNPTLQPVPTLAESAVTAPALADLLGRHLHQLQKHLEAVGRPAEAAAVKTDLVYVERLRAQLP